ncbi:uncharacterized protein RSE6_12960 [Rhynchosporium secalis]|uniref:Uncharacterized protein n=1 Tax=Rhynchosporium secalis TaxID=38038 RepID=A0A1E1MRS0_RHYSE|nr:uncharacterized protein RSE6_12960 [Rhynchosporium secalis]
MSQPLSKLSGTNNAESTSGNQQDNRIASGNQANVSRNWPSWPPTYATRSAVAHGITKTPVIEPTPMQRWMNETLRQSLWNNVEAVVVRKERYGDEMYNGSRGSAAGIWRSYSRPRNGLLEAS